MSVATEQSWNPNENGVGATGSHERTDRLVFCFRIFGGRCLGDWLWGVGWVYLQLTCLPPPAFFGLKSRKPENHVYLKLLTRKVVSKR